MPRPVSNRALIIGVSAAALVAAATGGAYAATASPRSPLRPSTPASSPAGPTVYAGYHDAPISLPSSLGNILSMRIPVAGNYVTFAKLTVWNGQNTDDTLTCELVAGADFDRSDTVLTGNTVPYANYAAMELNVVHHFARPGSVQLKCTGYGVTTTASWIKITAIRVGSLTNTALP
jgi:hypothetical protein